MIKNSKKLIHFYKKYPKMLSSPYTLHVELFRKFQKRLTPLGFKIFSRFPIKNSRVFDFGCGLGGFLAFTKINGAKLCIGRDLSNFILPENEKYIDHLEIGAKLPINQPSNYFDLVICSEVLEHTELRGKYIIKELIRITKKKGIIFISTPNYFNPCGVIKWINERTGHYDYHTWAPFQNFTPQTREQPLKSHKIIRELKKYPITFLERRSIWWIDSWAPWIHRYPEIKLYTGIIDLFRCHIDNVFSKCPYGGLQFYCILKKK